jgi:3'(2'), 5'-bisphosphate nucleotidase
MPCSLHKLVELALEAAQEAGMTIMRCYPEKAIVEYKQDGSPFTLADKEANLAITRRLAGRRLPIVSKDGAHLELAAERDWLVDPLDGTIDLLARNCKFTVSIALVDHGRAVLGVVFAPAIKTVQWGAKGLGLGEFGKGTARKLAQHSRSAFLRMAINRFHNHPDVDASAAQHGIAVRVAIGSALKHGFLAGAEVDVFPRSVARSEWDTERLGRRCSKRLVAKCWIGRRARLWCTGSHGAGTRVCFRCALPIVKKHSS